ATFACPRCGEPVSMADRVGPDAATCSACWDRVPIPNTLGTEEGETATASPVPPPLPSDGSDPSAPQNLGERYSSGELPVVVVIGIAAFLAVGMWAWGVWALHFQSELWLVSNASGTICY